VKAGADFLAPHRAAMWVLADHLHSWGVLPVAPEIACADDPDRPGAGTFRRYTLHSTSHMLGIDVHDCALARNEMYREGTLAAGYALTVEPGLYFQVNDRTVPAELRGIGVRIEDDVVVTDGEPMNLSAQLPRDAEELLAWMREVQATPARP
jgi:Xaa-Pro aminopeptidase